MTIRFVIVHVVNERGVGVVEHGLGWLELGRGDWFGVIAPMLGQAYDLLLEGFEAGEK